MIFFYKEQEPQKTYHEEQREESRETHEEKKPNKNKEQCGSRMNQKDVGITLNIHSGSEET
jgi:hypothetical protein